MTLLTLRGLLRLFTPYWTRMGEKMLAHIPLAQHPQFIAWAEAHPEDYQAQVMTIHGRKFLALRYLEKF